MCSDKAFLEIFARRFTLSHHSSTKPSDEYFKAFVQSIRLQRGSLHCELFDMRTTAEYFKQLVAGY